MTAPTNIPARDDPVLWRWPEGPWERVAARLGTGGAEAAATAVILCVLPPAWTALAAIILLDNESTVLQATAVLAVFALSSGFVLFAGLLRRGSRVVLTEKYLLHRAGFDRSGWKSVSVDAISMVLIYEGDGAIVLFGREGILLRTRHVGNPAGFADAVGAPTVFWPVNEPGNWGWAMYFLHVILIPPATLLAGYLTISLLNPLHEAMAHAGLDHWVPIMSSFAFWIAGIFSLGISGALFATIAIGRYFLPQAALREFRQMYDENRRLLGRSPAVRGKLNRWGTRYIAWCARVLGAGPLPEHRPELRHGATAEMAAEAQAMAEGAA